MSRTSGWPIVCLALAFAVFVNGPALLPQRFTPYPLMRWGDVLDLFTPVLLLPLYWLVLRQTRDSSPGFWSALAFVLLAALWAEAQGIHLAANSIGHLLVDTAGEPSGQLAHAFDEVLSHYLWHVAIVGLSVLFLVRERLACKRTDAAHPCVIGAAGVLYGVSFFLIVDEGQTVPLGLPFALGIVAWGLVRGRHHLKQHPLTFLIATYLVASILLVGWGLYWRGFPEFSSLGWIQ
jgi:hypothetical protein